MKKVVIIFTSLLLIFVIYLAYNEINYTNNNKDIVWKKEVEKVRKNS